MTTPPLAEVPVRSAAELTDRWAKVLDPPVFSARSLWLLWLDAEGRMLPVVVPLDDVPRLPDRALVDGLLGLHGAIAGQAGAGAHLALALCRPGRPVITAEDDAWVQDLRAPCDDTLDGTWSLHLAAGGRVLPLVEPRGWA